MSAATSSTPAAVPPQSPAAAGYFIDQKKGEVNELKQLLKNINVERDVKRKREIIKKVIAYMTLGIDVSRLFTDMIMAIETKDIVIKKMIYLYLCNYASKQPDMAIMCINSLRRDCDNEDPMVRGLALRSLCSLRLESILEYVQQPLQKSLTDLSAYVRKTGVMGILKLNGLSPTLIETNGYLEKLYQMLQDVDANVVTNVIFVLNELQLSQGGMETSQATVMHLLNRIGEFSEWGLNAILELVSRYQPTSEDETFAIMNLLDPVLRTANSGAVLATFKCFMKLTDPYPELQPQIYSRAKPPMLTLITGSAFEVQYATLKHLETVLPRKAAKGIFDDEFRQFFVRYNEPSHVKHLKVELLPQISNDANAKDIAMELGEYVTDVDSELSKRAISALGQIAMRVASVSPEITQTLMELVDLDIPYVRAEAVKTLSNVVRISPSVRVHVLPLLAKCLRRVDDSDAKAALIWMLGEYGQEIPESPYLLEPIIDGYDDEQSPQIKLQVLTAAMKIFFKRPPEMQQMLGRLFCSAVNDSTNQDVHDRALLYYRLLSSDSYLGVAESMFPGVNHTGTDAGLFAEDCDDEKRNQIFSEFNTLAVIYGMPSVQFIADEFQQKLENAPLVDRTFEVPVSASFSTVQQSAPLNVSVAPAMSASGDLNLLDLGFAAPAIPIKAAGLLLHMTDMSPPVFQQNWTSLSDVFNGRVCLLNTIPTSTSEIESILRSRNVCTMASGPVGGGLSGMKFFIYGSEEGDLLSGSDGAIFVAQLIVIADSGDVSAVVKSTHPSPTSGQAFADLLHSILSASFGSRQ